ncbi:MAG: YciK family oxidoreductase [Gammaproteobacteria bacterium]|nr:YciK family oxidoreductase [Gammaproteobacteria bacterium]NIR96553.1 YciK family oxidoreductase [Gammaproteobacteria bacterium]NIT62291.1 YciK family oxidoreductase [Gammaproteobacteria bacterium]NIV19195.1 YciK family oxidoreductase [Gammaproteobacteria bacterium]NIX10063.1 YciK family oxidoreductase [Gammaproteobacteria bacterium]
MRDYSPAPELLRERVLLITGAGAGIGSAVARAAARHGATVILLGRTIAKLEKVYDEIESAGSPQPAIYPMNLEGATVKDYEDLALTVEREFGRLDGLVHNAAALGTLAPLQVYEPALWYRVLQVNLNAPFLLTQACLGLLNQGADASVVFVSDGVGRTARAYWGAYAVSKFGLEGLMQILADETDSNTSIRANSVDPGPVRTALRNEAYPAEDKDALALPEHVVLPFLYLLGPDSVGVTGKAFRMEDFASTARGG